MKTKTNTQIRQTVRTAAPAAVALLSVFNVQAAPQPSANRTPQVAHTASSPAGGFQAPQRQAMVNQPSVNRNTGMNPPTRNAGMQTPGMRTPGVQNPQTRTQTMGHAPGTQSPNSQMKNPANTPTPNQPQKLSNNVPQQGPVTNITKTTNVYNSNNTHFGGRDSRPNSSYFPGDRGRDSFRPGQRAERERESFRAGEHFAREHSRRIPDAMFRSHFGRYHEFRVDRPVVIGGAAGFHFGGVFFTFATPWPVGWAYRDSVYVENLNGSYFLFNRMYPGVRVALNVDCPNCVAQTDAPCTDCSQTAVVDDSQTAESGIPTLYIGETIDDVLAAMGTPNDIVDLGGKKIYVFARVKVTFIGGRLTDAG